MRIEPNPHRIFARAEHINVADTIESGELVTNLEQSVITGKKLIERSIRFYTSTCAVSRLVPSLNVMLKVMLPSLVLCEDM